MTPGSVRPQPGARPRIPGSTITRHLAAGTLRIPGRAAKRWPPQAHRGDPAQGAPDGEAADRRHLRGPRRADRRRSGHRHTRHRDPLAGPLARRAVHEQRRATEAQITALLQPRSRRAPRSTANTPPEAATGNSIARCCPRSPLCTIPPPAPTTTSAGAEERLTYRPASGSPGNRSTCCSRHSATAPATNPEPHASLGEDIEVPLLHSRVGSGRSGFRQVRSQGRHLGAGRGTQPVPAADPSPPRSPGCAALHGAGSAVPSAKC